MRVFATCIIVVIIDYLWQEEKKNSRIGRRSVHTSVLQGQAYVNELLNESGGDTRILETRGVTKAEFNFILGHLKDRHLISARKQVSTKEQLAIFLCCMHKGMSNRQLQERFQRSGSTIHEVFHDIQSALVACSEEWIVNPTGRFQRGLMTTLHYPFFKHCVGAIDGTHVPVVLRMEDQDSHRCRKLKTTQNVMCCVDWDTRVRYVLAGWEGSAHDMRVFKDAHTSHDFT